MFLGGILVGGSLANRAEKVVGGGCSVEYRTDGANAVAMSSCGLGPRRNQWVSLERTLRREGKARTSFIVSSSPHSFAVSREAGSVDM